MLFNKSSLSLPLSFPKTKPSVYITLSLFPYLPFYLTFLSFFSFPFPFPFPLLSFLHSPIKPGESLASLQNLGELPPLRPSSLSRIPFLLSLHSCSQNPGISLCLYIHIPKPTAQFPGEPLIN